MHCSSRTRAITTEGYAEGMPREARRCRGRHGDAEGGTETP